MPLVSPRGASSLFPPPPHAGPCPHGAPRPSGHPPPVSTPSPRSQHRHASAGPGLVRLRVVSGPDVGREVLLDGGGAWVGSRADCTLVLSDPAVAPRHARLELREG